MSLINQMLRDLDARTGEPAPLGAARSVRSAPRSGLWWLLAGGLLLAAAAAGSGWWLLHRGPAPGVSLGGTTARPAGQHPASGGGKAPAAAAVTSRGHSAPAGPAPHLSAIIAGSEHSLILTFSPPLRSPALAGPAPVVRADIPATANLDGLGTPPHLKGLTAFRLAPSPAGLVLLARAAPGYRVRLGPAPNAAPLGAALSLEVIPPAAQTGGAAAAASATRAVPAARTATTHQAANTHHPTNPTSPPPPTHEKARPHHHLPAATATTPAREPETGGTAEIKRVPETAGERAAHAYDRAMKALRNGDRGKAEGLLRRSLSDKPDYTDARVLLAAVLMRAQRNAEALQVLSEGIHRPGGNDSRFALLKARILAGEGELPKAIATLRSHAPTLSDNPAYHARLAAYEARAGQYAAAAKTYHALVAQSPNNARWWLGLAIALDQLGDNGAAHAYQQALDAGGLPSKAAAYAKSRLHALGG